MSAMRTKRRKLGQYRCWLCDKHLKITCAPYNRDRYSTCYCDEDGLPGGYTETPDGWTEEQVKKAREEYAERQET